MATPPTRTADPAAPATTTWREPSRARRLTSPVGTAALAAAATVALHLRDPHVSGSWGWCPVALVGLACPLCGSLRAVNDLTHLDVAAAASSNLLLLVALPVVGALWLRRVAACWRGGAAMRPLSPPAWVWWALGAVALVFTVARNTPAGAWLAP